MEQRKQVWLPINSVWAWVEQEDDNFIIAQDPIDMVTTCVDKKAEYYTRQVMFGESVKHNA